MFKFEEKTFHWLHCKHCGLSLILDDAQEHPEWYKNCPNCEKEVKISKDIPDISLGFCCPECGDFSYVSLDELLQNAGSDCIECESCSKTGLTWDYFEEGISWIFNNFDDPNNCSENIAFFEDFLGKLDLFQSEGYTYGEPERKPKALKTYHEKLKTTEWKV